MNIVFINRYSFSYLGGVEIHILNLAKELVKHGHKITLVCRDDSRKASGWVPEFDDIRVVHVSGFLGLCEFLRREAEHIDVCHAHLARSTFSYFAVLCASLLGIPTVFTPHCFYPSSSAINRVLKWLYDQTCTRFAWRCSRSVINLTPQDQRDAAKRGMPLQKSTIIPNSISFTQLQNAPVLSFRERYDILGPYLLHVGRFHATKCVEFLVNNLSALKGLTLVLIGQDDGSLPTVSRLVHTLGLEGRVRVIQRVEFGELCSAYREARALVMASCYEGLPTVVLEAAAFGIPAVAPRVGGIPFIIQDGVTGYLYNWDDENGYIDSVRRALAEGQKVGAAARVTMSERFSWEVNAQKIMAIYHELVQKPGIGEPLLVK